MQGRNGGSLTVCYLLCYIKAMATVTIPKEFAGYQKLIAVPHESYEAFIVWERQRKAEKTFLPTTAQKQALAKARRNRASGKLLTLNELTESLARPR